MPNYTAGSGEPYWYEWTVGLLKIVEMLHTDSDIESVTFQAHGSKGWDDVVVHRREQRREWYQVKHSSAGTNFTFGTLVAKDGGESLLQTLYSASVDLKIDPVRDRCTLFTNREAGERATTSDAGIRRPPLLQFIDWLKQSVRNHGSLAGCNPPLEWAGAWTEWIEQLKGGSQADVINFLSALEVRTDQEDLEVITHRVLRDLAGVFGVTETAARPLIHTLDHALRDWTRTGEAITAETVMDALALEEKTDGEHRAPPPPAPFFPSREPFLQNLEHLLTQKGGAAVLFLSAEPGAGKTSALSELVNRRTDDALQGVVGIRYFAFRPLTPESPVIPADSDRFVKADALWFDLLRQLRRGLRGRLRAYSVPPRDQLLDWPQARNHVLRLASRLAKELDRPFVIAIDGIDHAARAHLHDSAGAREFFASLPSPEELSQSGIRLLVAGQPAHDYPQYPQWLRSPPQSVAVLSLDRLQPGDIMMLLERSAPLLPVEQRQVATRVIQDITRGNTLGVVFAAAEAASCDNTEALQQRLQSRQLQSGITAYYQNIWDHCVGGLPAELGFVLAGSIALARERMTGALLESAFAELNRSEQEWNLLLGRLGPLLMHEPEGYRVRHNDLRVFLQGSLAALSAGQRREIASGFVNHYKKPTSNRRIAHESLLFLLRESGREQEWPRLFTVAWVMEAAGLGFDYDDIEPQCIAALKIAATLHDWDVIGDVACACETLERWRERCEGDRPSPLVTKTPSSPTFLRSELFVRPLNDWESSDLHRLATDSDELLGAGEGSRASALLNRWLGGLDISTICGCLKDKKDAGPFMGEDKPMLSREARGGLEGLGRACRRAQFVVPLGASREDLAAQGAYAFEKGWFEASSEDRACDSLTECFLGQQPRFLATIADTARAFAESGEWSLLKELLILKSANRKALHKHRPTFSYQAAWWSLRSGAANECKDWLEPVADQQPVNLGGEGGLVSALAVARARGWMQAATEIATIGDELVNALTLSDARAEHSSYYGRWLRAAATIGRIHGVLFRSGPEAASEMIRPLELQQIAVALWDQDHRPIAIHSDWFVAGKLASELVEVSVRLSSEHIDAVLKAAQKPLESWPIDDRRESLWNLLQGAGRIEQLREWLDRWIGENGLVLVNSASDREYIVDKWTPFAAEIGAQDLVDTMRHKLASGRITYRSDRDETFFAASTLLDELLRRDPGEWTSTGLHLWSLSDAAYGLDCGNNYEDAIDTALAKGAFRSGPGDIVRLVFAEEPNRRDHYWLHEVRNLLINGITRIARENDQLTPETRLTFWCLAIGFCRWFQNGDVHRLRELRSALIDTTPLAERHIIVDEMFRITPAEAVREPYSREGQEHKPPDSKPAEEPSFESSLRQISEGGACLLPRCVELVREILRSRHAEAGSLIPMVLRSVGRNYEYTYQWRTETTLSIASINELARLLSDSQLWPLMETTCNNIQKGWYWLQGVTDNIQVLCVARAAARGTESVRRALNRQMAMHERWIRGLNNDFPFNRVALPESISLPSWHAAAAHIFAFLLNSRTGEVLASAIHGIHCLVAHKPEIVQTMFELTNDDEWKARWVLNASEGWAGTTPTALEPAKRHLIKWLENGPLEHRLQAWIVNASLCLQKNESVPPLPWPEHQPRGIGIATQPREVLELPPETHGLMHVSDRHRAATHHLDCLEAAVGELTGARQRTAELLDHLPERRRRHPWPNCMRQHGDTNVGLDDVGLIIGRALEETMPAPRGELVPRLAQGFLPNEDPWVLRHTPLPDTDLSAWPEEDEIGGWQQTPNISRLRERLLLLACEHATDSNETVLAARVEVYSSFYDVHFNVWWEQQRGDQSEVSPSRLPTTINARTFCWWLGNWWQPSASETSRPLAYVPGGFQRLVHCFVEWFPARLWIRQFDWKPSMSDPLTWTFAGKPVARFERLHGRTRDTQNYHYRQPTLTRWVVKQSAFEMISSRLGRLRRSDDIVYAPSPER